MSELVINADLRKPPVAPKPKMVRPLVQGLSPAMPRREGLALPSPGTQRKARPAVAPRRFPPKPSSDVELTSPASKSLDQTPVTGHPRPAGPAKSHNGVQQENKRPDWDYVIPICLCNLEKCSCITNTSVQRDKTEKALKTLHKGKTEDGRKPQPTAHVVIKDKTSPNPQTVSLQPPTNNSQPNNWKHMKEKPALDKNADTDASSPSVNASPSFLDIMLTYEENFKKTPRQTQEGDRLDPRLLRLIPKPEPVPRKPVWKAREAVLARQEKVEDEKESVSHKGRGVRVREGTGSSFPSVSVPAHENKQPARKAGAPPAPPPEKKPLLSEPTFGPQDVVEEDLGWDIDLHEMEVSVDGEDRDLEQEDGNDEDGIYSNILEFSSPPSRPMPSQAPAATAAAEVVPRAVKVPQMLPPRQTGPAAGTQRKESSEERGEHCDNDKRRAPRSQDGVLLKSATPSPPEEKKSRKQAKTGATKSSRSSVSKAKSFSGADAMRSQVQKKSSFRNLLDLKLAVQQRIGKGRQRPGSPEKDDGDDKEHLRSAEDLRDKRKASLPQVGVKQSEEEEKEEAIYESISSDEDISDYANLLVAKTEAPPTAWDSDENLYEMPDPYVPLEKHTEQHQHQHQTQSHHSEEEQPVDEDPSDEITFNSSDEEFNEDSSSISSKGEPDGNMVCQTQNGQKKSKIHYIATEIMTSERVFVGVLKLLHVDFREAVLKASTESGKPVIEERLLDQILYYLPQLYEFNQELLRELTERLANWNETSQIADIFLKKGPFLKMYSTYIREYDKNAALLEEQTKKNPAFGAVVQEFEASPCCFNLALRHYLLKPIQRIPQYQLLLTDYLKNLSEDSADHKDTQAALALVKEVANHANDIMKQGDDFQRMMRVQSSLTGNQEIVKPGRVLLKEGSLMKHSRKNMQPRMFFLFNDVLLYTIPLPSGQYELKYTLSLKGMEVSKPLLEAYQNELNIESVERSCRLSASSVSERDEWLKALSNAITDKTKKSISFVTGKPPEEVEPTDSTASPALGSRAPIWIPDLRVTMCMICACEFTIARRRHHCRACGKVVCKSCSANEYCLKYLKDKSGRVCDQCFDILSQQKETIHPGKKSIYQKKSKNIPKALKEVQANTDSSSMSGYLQMSEAGKKQAKRLWFVIKDKVLYTYAASENVAASRSQPLLGFTLEVESPEKFTLYHQGKLYYSFKADDVETAQRWINSIKEAAVL
ncbi:FYVE, RhoGEF and PH domain-containing protein 6-like [Betta splendens]|uniref:FYVE, RhoGEF and PH domain-containing protein 6-like n=1 Tax=Betta splendens TaxID=158456 RepID=A0A6P7MNY5_BETSP|nr:FYVE, RhoGEF and PH domain-containing protein 6-like [Betta splendens]